jgi:hypothetical protein
MVYWWVKPFNASEGATRCLMRDQRLQLSSTSCCAYNTDRRAAGKMHSQFFDSKK